MAEDHPQRAAPLPVTAWRRLLINGPVVASALARPAQRSGIAARALVAAWSSAPRQPLAEPATLCTRPDDATRPACCREA